MILRVLLLGCISLALPGVGAGAQAPTYQPQQDTLFVATRNPYHMFFVRGTDTLGNRAFSRVVTREVWQGVKDGLLIETTRRDLGFAMPDTLVRQLFMRDGRERSLDGRAPHGLPSSLMPLPAVPLRKGLTWKDSSVIARDTNGFAMRYESGMTFRVERMVDTLGARVAEVVAEGRYRMRAQFGDTAGQRLWIDVSGPDKERFLFDITRGRQLYRSWDMTLRGWGGGRLPGDSVVSHDSVPAGLDSKSFSTLLPSDEGEVVWYRHVGRDTSITVTVPHGGVAGVHVIHRTGDSVVSSHIRADGDMTVERATYDRGRLQRYERTWKDTAIRVHRERVTHAGDSVIIHGANGARRAFPAEASYIGAGDIGREELLVPLLLRLPQDSIAVKIGVFRPSFNRIDYATIHRRKVHGGWLIELAWERGGEESDVWLIDDSGDLLFVEARSDEHTRRVPAQPPRVDAMTAIGKALREGG